MRPPACSCRKSCGAFSPWLFVSLVCGTGRCIQPKSCASCAVGRGEAGRGRAGMADGLTFLIVAIRRWGAAAAAAHRTRRLVEARREADEAVLAQQVAHRAAQVRRAHACAAGAGRGREAPPCDAGPLPLARRRAPRRAAARPLDPSTGRCASAAAGPGGAASPLARRFEPRRATHGRPVRRRRRRGGARRPRRARRSCSSRTACASRSCRRAASPSGRRAGSGCPFPSSPPPSAWAGGPGRRPSHHSKSGGAPSLARACSSGGWSCSAARAARRARGSTR